MNIEDHLSAEQMALCPLCDNAIEEFEPVCIVVAHGFKSLAHTPCYQELLDDGEDEEEEDDEEEEG